MTLRRQVEKALRQSDLDLAQKVARLSVSGGGVGGAAWGGITGTLADQTDLQTALNAKATTASLSSHTGATSGAHGISVFGASLVDDADAAAARTTLGLGTAATTAATDYATAAHGHSGLAPTGGTTGQVLKKASNTNYDYTWQNDATGAGGGSVGAAVVDFGATPVAEATFTVTDAGVSGASVIQAWVIGDSTADNDAQSHIQASRSFRLTATPGSGSFSLDVMALMGLCAGTFNVHYRY